MTRENLILPTTEVYERDALTLLKFRFTDGTLVDEVTLKSTGDTVAAIANADGSIIDNPMDGRYPFSARVARLAIDHFHQMGERE